jgi:hypothetical protein
VFVNVFSTSSSWKVNNTVRWSKLPLTIGVVFFAFEIVPFVRYRSFSHYIPWKYMHTCIIHSPIFSKH